MGVKLMSHFNPEAEKMLIGCILLDSSIAKVIDIEASQVSVLYRPIFESIKKITESGNTVDAGTLYERLGSSYMAQIDLKEMAESVASPEAYKGYESTIKRSYKNSKIRELVQNFVNNTQDVLTEEDTTVFVDKMNELNSDLSTDNDFNLQETLIKMFDKADQGIETTGLKTGYNVYDQITGGHRKGELIIVGARPSVGKTAFALNVAEGHMKNGSYGHLYSLETSQESFLNRMISAKGYVDSHRMRMPKKRFDTQDWERYSYAMGEIGKHNMYIDERSTVKIPEIYARTRKLMRKYPDQDHFIMIDYLQLLQPTQRKGNRQEEVSDMSRQLKVMARDLKIPVIVLSQLSREVEKRQDKRPTLADLRESGSIEQDADIVVLLYRDDYYDAQTEKKDIIEIIIAKQKEGPIGTVELAFIKEYNRFANLERKYDVS